MQMALAIVGVWTLSAILVALALWKDRERAPEAPFQKAGQPNEPDAAPATRRRRTPAAVPSYPAAGRR